MAKAKRGRSRRLVLDIGSSAIRLCELSQTKEGYQLTKYIQEEIQNDPSLDEAERNARRIEALKNVLKAAKTRAKKTVFGVAGQSVFTRIRALPPVPEHKVTQIVRYEIQQQIPFSLDQIALDYQVLNRTEAGGYEVLMAAIKVDVVEKQLDLLREVRKGVDTVDVAPLAAYNWLKFTGEFGDQGECVALVDLGASTTDIVIERENQFRFTRSLNLGGNDITSAIAKAFNISFAEAEKLKRERGFAPTGDPQRDGKGGEVIGQVLQRLVTEISRSFAYFRSQPGGGPVSRVIVTGGGASLRNIIPFLQRRLGIEVRIAQPLAGIVVGAGAQAVNEVPEQAVTVLGLALRCNEHVPIEVNLIPPRIIEAVRRTEQMVYWIMSLVTLGLIMAAIIPLKANQDKAIQQLKSEYKAKLVLYDPEFMRWDGATPPPRSTAETELADLQAKVTNSQNQVANLDLANNSRRYWLQYLVAINDALPPNASIVIKSFTTANVGTLAAGARRPSFPIGGGKFGGGGILGQLGAASAGSLAPPTPTEEEGPLVVAVGFTNLAPRFEATAAGPGPAASSGPPPAPLPPTEPNGISITGYARDPKSIPLFVARLKESPLFNPEGVFFDDATANEVPWSQLDASSQSSLQAGLGGSFGQAYADSDEEEYASRERGSRGITGFGFGRGATGPAAPATSIWGYAEPTFTSFQINMLFAGQELKDVEGGQYAGAAGAYWSGGYDEEDEEDRRRNPRNR